MYHVYVLRSTVTGRLYTGSTADIQDRLRRHNAGECKATRHGVPWTLVYTEAYPTRAEAFRREQYFKTGRGREELERLIAGSTRDAATSG
jgi:putative endonuclease